MNLAEIKEAVNIGKTVNWCNESYQVVKHNDQWYMTCKANDSTIGLTWKDGKTLNGDPAHFFINEGPVALLNELLFHRKDWSLQDIKDAYEDEWDEVPDHLGLARNKMEEYIYHTYDPEYIKQLIQEEAL